MDGEIISYLREGRISKRRLGDLGLGTVGITLNPHFILNRSGERTGWLAKRLRARQYADPAATFSRFQREHELVSSYFGESPGAKTMIPDTEFVVLDRNLDDHPDYQPNREYVMVQRFVQGISLEEAVPRLHTQAWLANRVLAFVEAYQRMQREAFAVLDCFSIRSDHVKVDTEHQRVLLIDTNNPVVLPLEAAANALFGTKFEGDILRVTPDDVHDVFDALCASGEYDPAALVCTRDQAFLRDACAIEHLVRYFPRGGAPNRYLREVLALSAKRSLHA